MYEYHLYHLNKMKYFSKVAWWINFSYQVVWNIHCEYKNPVNIKKFIKIQKNNT